MTGRLPGISMSGRPEGLRGLREVSPAPPAVVVGSGCGVVPGVCVNCVNVSDPIESTGATAVDAGAVTTVRARETDRVAGAVTLATALVAAVIGATVWVTGAAALATVLMTGAAVLTTGAIVLATVLTTGAAVLATVLMTGAAVR